MTDMLQEKSYKEIIKLKNAYAEVFSFSNDTEAKEYHITVHISNTGLNFRQQLETLINSYNEIRISLSGNAVAVFKRYFLSDSANQENEVFDMETSDCAISVIQQAPIDGSKVALWAYLITGVKTRVLPNGLYMVKHNAYTHLWLGNCNIQEINSEYQTRMMLQNYVIKLIEAGCTLADNCVRTWFFINDIDNNYTGVVKARNDIFMTQNLTPDTHYISSTGIGGRQSNHEILAQMDAYSINGIEHGQMKYVYAPENMNRTSEYGVSFERGTYIDYGDRRHIFISGTASIDNKGNILYPENIKRQTLRMLENVGALLKEADMDFTNIGITIVYLRDIADYTTVKNMFDDKFKNSSCIIVNASVCRPGWLIEMECMGVRDIVNKQFKTF